MGRHALNTNSRRCGRNPAPARRRQQDLLRRGIRRRRTRDALRGERAVKTDRHIHRRRIAPGVLGTHLDGERLLHLHPAGHRHNQTLRPGAHDLHHRPRQLDPLRAVGGEQAHRQRRRLFDKSLHRKSWRTAFRVAETHAQRPAGSQRLQEFHHQHMIKRMPQVQPGIPPAQPGRADHVEADEIACFRSLPLGRAPVTRPSTRERNTGRGRQSGLRLNGHVESRQAACSQHAVATIMRADATSRRRALEQRVAVVHPDKAFRLRHEQRRCRCGVAR